MSLDKISRQTLEITPQQLKNIFWRILSFLLSSTFFSLIPIIFFLAYMLENNFFSYDFFEKGVFGMKAFFSLLVISLLAISAVLFMPMFPLMQWKYKKKKNTFNLISSALISLLFWALIVYISTMNNNSKWPFIVYVSTIGFAVVLQINLMIHANPQVQFIALSIIISLTFYLTFAFRDVASGLIGNTLRSYGSGGGVCVTITDTLDSYALKGKLVLASPDYIYFKSNGFTSITAVKVDSQTIYKTGNEECIEDQ